MHHVNEGGLIYSTPGMPAIRAARNSTSRIVALARKLLIGLWRLVTTGEVPEGVVLRPARCPRNDLAPRPNKLAAPSQGPPMMIRGGGDPRFPLARKPLFRIEPAHHHW